VCRIYSLEVQLNEATSILGLSFGRNTLYGILRDWGWVLQDSTVPSRDAQSKGWLVAKESISATPDKYGNVHRSTVTYITLRGRLKLLEELLKRDLIVETEAVANLMDEL